MASPGLLERVFVGGSAGPLFSVLEYIFFGTFDLLKLVFGPDFAWSRVECSHVYEHVI